MYSIGPNASDGSNEVSTEKWPLDTATGGHRDPKQNDFGELVGVKACLDRTGRNSMIKRDTVPTLTQETDTNYIT